jgi:hypothetical protein
MKKKLSAFFLFSFIICSLVYSQTQVGQIITGSNFNDHLGYSSSASADGLRLALGSREYPGYGPLRTGYARIFELRDTTWHQLGVDIDGDSSQDELGYAVALSGDGMRFAAGAPNNDVAGTRAGHVKTFQWNGTSWVKMGADILGERRENRSGASVALSHSRKYTGNRSSLK